MKNIISKLEDLWVSITFAEAGELETSQLMLTNDFHEVNDVASCPAV